MSGDSKLGLVAGVLTVLLVAVVYHQSGPKVADAANRPPTQAAPVKVQLPGPGVGLANTPVDPRLTK
jgi:hypothetical protein